MKEKITISRPASLGIYWGKQLPSGSVAIGNVTRGRGESGILFKIGNMYCMGNAGVLRSLPHGAVIKALNSKI